MPNIHSNISFGLVSIPVLMNPVIKNNDTSFNQLHKKCLHRIEYVKYCPFCHDEVKEAEIIKGFEYEKDNYLTFSKDELDKLKLDNDKLIEVVSFIKSSEIDQSFYEKSYFLEADSKTPSYELFCEALKETKKVALAKTVLGSKFYYCILRFNEVGVILTTLYFKEEVKIPNEKLKNNFNQKDLKLALKLIDSLSGKFTPDNYIDEYQNRIKKAINDKMDGKTIKKVKNKNRRQISDLTKALEMSLKDFK
jgi:DNA end-binding protein Ku